MEEAVIYIPNTEKTLSLPASSIIVPPPPPPAQPQLLHDLIDGDREKEIPRKISSGMFLREKKAGMFRIYLHM